LSGEQSPEYRGYVAARFADNPYLWASSLFDEVVVPRVWALI
jgi:hypothetical protein